MQENWLPQDAVTTREFLNSPTGQKFFQMLKESVPMDSGLTEIEEAMCFRQYKGGMQVISKIKELAEDVAPHVDPALEFYDLSADSEPRTQ